MNPAMRDPILLEVALTRFGCCPPDHVAEHTRRWLSQGQLVTPEGHSVRLVMLALIEKW